MDAHAWLPLDAGSQANHSRVRDRLFPEVDTQSDDDNIRTVPQLNTKQDRHEEGVD